MCNITFTQKSYFCGSGEIVRGQTTAICTVVTFGLEVISLQMALLAFTNTFLCLTSWAVSFFSLANSFESLANCFSELANCFRQLLITMPWFRLRHHFRHFFRQFISSDMMIFQIDMVQRKGERLPVLYPCLLLPPYCCGAVLWLNGQTFLIYHQHLLNIATSQQALCSEPCIAIQLFLEQAQSALLHNR